MSFKILDRYILKNFLGTFVMTELIILVLAIVVDMSEKIDKFLAYEAPAGAILTYYMDFCIYYGSMYMSLVVFLAATIFTSQFAARSEIIAIFSSGVKYDRFLRPYVIGAVIITGVSLMANNFIIPSSNIRRLKFEEVYVDGGKSFDEEYKQNIHKQVAPGQIIYIQEWRTRTNTGNRFSLETFDTTGVLVSKLNADYISYDKDSMTFKLSTCFIRHINPDGTERLSSEYAIDTAFAFTPDDFAMDKYIGEKKNTVELSRIIEQEIERGSAGVRILKTERYKRLSMPFSTIILTVLAVTLCSRKKRGGTGINIAVGITLMAAYLFMLRIFETIAAQGTDAFPLLWVWIPNILFTIIAYYTYKNAKK